MKKKTIDGHMTVTAGVGKFVATADRKVYGKTLSLGVNTTAAEIIEDNEDKFQKPEEEAETDQIQEI